MKKIGILIGLLALSVGCAHRDMDHERVTLEERNEADRTFDLVSDTDPYMKKFAKNSYAYIIFPSIGKGAVGIGGAYGKGLVYKKGRLIGTSELTQASIGLQLGGQSYTQIVFFENEMAFKKFKHGSFQLSGSMSAVALKRGASANAVYKDGVVIFIMAEEGLMGELAVGGQHLSFAPIHKR